VVTLAEAGLDRQQPSPARLHALDRTGRHAAPSSRGRRGELCAVRWSNLDLDQGEVLIAGGTVRVPGESLVDKATKTHAKRRVAVGADTAELLRAHRLAQAKDALACGTTLAADADVFSHALTDQTRSTPTASPTAFAAWPDDSACAAGCMTCGTSWSPSSWPAVWTGAPSLAGPVMRTAT